MTTKSPINWHRDFLRVIGLSSIAALSACDSPGPTYTLYRDSPFNAHVRIHVATFDSKQYEAKSYNEEYCNTVAALLRAQPDVQTSFWCEEGRYRE